MFAISRRGVMVGGGVGVGLVVAWTLWPRDYAPNITVAPGETAFGAWLKIGIDGHVTIAVPQLEHGQGVYTALPQIVADELGADWRTIGVEAAPINALYANPLALAELFDGTLQRLPDDVLASVAARSAAMLTGGSTSVRQFEEACRVAGATARALLCQAAAKRLDVAAADCGVEAGFVVNGTHRIRFAELAAEAAGLTPPDPLPLGTQGAGKLMGQSVPRLDIPAKVDGSANFAGDIRLPDMVFAALRQGPIGTSRLVSVDRAAADRVRGVLQIVENPGWVAAVATSWWAAAKALDAMAPRFETTGGIVDSASIERALTKAFDEGGLRVATAGDLGDVFKGANIVTADYAAGAGVHVAIETMSATAAFRNGRLELWLPTAAPEAARAAAARVAGIAEDAVAIHVTMAGGAFGATLDPLIAEQAALLAVKVRRPVSLVWSRGEDIRHDRYRPPARARMAARIAANGTILGWSAKIAAPATGEEIAARVLPRGIVGAASTGAAGDRYAVAGAVPPYRLPAMAIDHHPADIGVPTGHLRGGAHGYTCFFTESFIDELAHVAGNEPLSYRIGMLGGDARLARCLSTVAALGGWDGGVAGSGQGIACHAFRGSFIAVLAEAHVDADQSISVDRLVAAVDCGRVVNPDLVRQQIEGGLVFGMAQALGASTGFAKGMAAVRGMAGLDLPRLADTPDIIVDIARSDEDPGGVGELAVPPVAPAIANALRSATGYRIRSLPLKAGR
jgi:isoquinoline 1-oxidoreductase subunit beta